jgi:hypothetical protein
MVEGWRERGYLDDRFAILGVTQKGRNRALDAQVITWEGRQFRGSDLILPERSTPVACG